jgi:hypothetical protein
VKVYLFVKVISLRINCFRFLGSFNMSFLCKIHELVKWRFPLGLHQRTSVQAVRVQQREFYVFTTVLELNLMIISESLM